MKQRFFNLTREFDYGVLLPAIQSLPRAWGISATDLRGELIYRFRTAWRKACLEDLALAFPEWSREERRRVARGVAKTLAHDELETRWFERPAEWFESRMEVQGFDQLRDACSGGQGALLYTAHTGCPGTAICYLGTHGIPIHLVFRPLANVEGMPAAWRRYGDARIRSLEKACGRGTLYTGKTNYFAMRRALRSGEAVIIALDVMPSVAGRCVEVDFLGRRTLLPEGPARLYRDTGARVFYWANTLARPKHRLRIVDVTDSLADCADLRAMTQTLAGPVEEEIRQRPGEWMMWGAFREFFPD